MHKSETEQGKSMLQDYELQKAVAVSRVLGKYPKEVEESILSKYQLETQRFNQNTKMNAIDVALANLSLNTKRFGLNESDSAFLRVLAQMWNGSDKGSSSMMPYVIGERVAGFAGDVLKTATPKLPFQRYQFSTKPKQPAQRGWRTMRSNYEFDRQ